MSQSMTIFSYQSWTIKKIQDDLNSGKIKGIQIIRGAFGDIERCEGIVEETIAPREGGLFSKIYGCSFLFKGYPVNEIVENLAFAKSFISLVPRKTLAKSYILMGAFGLLYIFSRKWFWYYMNVVAYSIHLNVVQKSGLQRQFYNKPTNTLRAAVDIALTKRVENHKQYRGLSFFSSPYNWPNGLEIWSTIACIFDFIYLFLEYDNAYRFRLQYVFSKLNKKNAAKNPRKELARIFDLLIENEHPTDGIRKKWEEIRKPVLALLWLSKDFRAFVKDFMLNLDVKEFELDENDWYFCLNRKSSHFGIPLKERQKIKEIIDKFYNHGYVDIYFNLTQEQVIEMNKQYGSEALHNATASLAPISVATVNITNISRLTNAAV